MRIGVVSDTHNNLKNVRKIVELFNEHRVDRVIHTGDISQAKTLDALSALNAPLFGVFGNNDQERCALKEAIDRHGFTFQDPPLALEWAGKKIIVVHDPLEFAGHLEAQDLALHGHTHRYRLEVSGDGMTIFNPGECAGMMVGRNAIGLVDLATLDCQILNF
jgi:putative phosphoesterase